MLKRSTVISIVVLAALVGLAIYLSRQKETKSETEAVPTESQIYLFNESDGLPNAVKIEDKQGKVVAVRQELDGRWTFEQPISAETEEGFVDYATSELTTLLVLNTMENMPPAAVGLDHPAYIITIGFSGGKETTFKVGNPTATGSGYYAFKEDGEMVIISKSGVDTLLEIYNNPPEVSTETPDPTAMEATATP